MKPLQTPFDIQVAFAGGKQASHGERLLAFFGGRFAFFDVYPLAFKFIATSRRSLVCIEKTIVSPTCGGNNTVFTVDRGRPFWAQNRYVYTQDVQLFPRFPDATNILDPVQ